MRSFLAFRPSAEVRKLSYQIYLYGGVAIAARLYNAKLTKIPLIDVSTTEIDIASVVGIVLFYLSVTLVSLYLSELFSEQFSRLSIARDQVVAAASTSDLFPQATEEPQLQGLLAQIDVRERKLGVFATVVETLQFMAEVLCPVTFLALCYYLLWRSSVAFIKDLVWRL